MTSDVYERGRRDLSPLLPPSKRSLSSLGPVRCAPPPQPAPLTPTPHGQKVSIRKRQLGLLLVAVVEMVTMGPHLTELARRFLKVLRFNFRRAGK